MRFQAQPFTKAVRVSVPLRGNGLEELGHQKQTTLLGKLWFPSPCGVMDWKFVWC